MIKVLLLENESFKSGRGAAQRPLEWEKAPFYVPRPKTEESLLKRGVDKGPPRMKNANAGCTHVSRLQPCLPPRKTTKTDFNLSPFFLCAHLSHSQCYDAALKASLCRLRNESQLKKVTLRIYGFLFKPPHPSPRLPLCRFKNMVQSSCHRKCNSSFCIVIASSLKNGNPRWVISTDIASRWKLFFLRKTFYFRLRQLKWKRAF